MLSTGLSGQPSYISDLLKPVSETHNRNLRSVTYGSLSDVKCCVTRYNEKKNTGIPFVDQKNSFSLLQTLTYYTSFYPEQNSGHAYIKFVNTGLTIGSDVLPETYALTSKCHVPCYAKHHIRIGPVLVKKLSF